MIQRLIHIVLDLEKDMFSDPDLRLSGTKFIVLAELKMVHCKF